MTLTASVACPDSPGKTRSRSSPRAGICQERLFPLGWGGRGSRPRPDRRHEWRPGPWTRSSGLLLGQRVRGVHASVRGLTTSRAWGARPGSPPSPPAGAGTSRLWTRTALRRPFPARLGRWADPRVVGSTAVTQGMHVRAVQFDPCAYLISSADGPVTGDDDIDVVRHALEQPQPGEVVLDRVIGAVQGRASESGHQKACRRRREPRAPRSTAPHGPGHAPDAR